MSEQHDGGAPVATSLKGFAPAPVSTRLMSEKVTVRSYGESWCGDDSDAPPPDQVIAFVDIDMTAWATAFMRATDALFAPDMAAAIASVDPEHAASLARYRRRLAKVIARTLIPVLIVPGEVSEIEPARMLFGQALLESLGTAYATGSANGGPLRACPPLPVISDARAITAQAPASIAEALLWDYAVTVEVPQAAQDELLVSVALNAPLADPAAEATVSAAMADSLFEALARMIFEYPQIAPHLATAPEDGNAAVARAALDRVDALIGDVTRTWPDWFEHPLPQAVEIGSASTVDHVTWSYNVDFARPPELRVTRLSGSNGALPPWPMIAGFVTPSEDGQAIGDYQALTDSSAGALTFAWTGLPIISVQTVHGAASTKRNANLVPPGAPEGTLVDPAFIYRTPIVAAPAISPFADPPSPIPIGADAATLSEAVDALFAPLLAAPTIAGLAMRDIQIKVAASWQVLSGSEDVPIDIGIPIFLVQTTLALSPNASDVAIPVGIFRRRVIDALVDWHAATRPEDVRAAIRFAITLSPADGEDRAPLAHLGQLEVMVPAAQPDWWR